MRKKQVLAMLLTGALTMSLAPAATYAAEDVSALSIEDTQISDVEPAADIPTETAEEPSAETSAETPSDAPAQETPTEAPETPTEAPTAPPTETPTETPTEAPTQVPTETPVTEVPTQTPEGQVPSTVPADGNLQPGDTTPTPTPTEAAEGPFSVGTQSFATLAEALAAVTTTPKSDDVDVILVNQDIEIDSAVTIPADKSVIFAAPAGKSIKITRKAGFTGNMFEVKGGMLQFWGYEDVDDNGNDINGTLTVNGAGNGTTGSIVSVSEAGIFGLQDHATLTGNSTSANGSAVNCTSGSVMLIGGSVTGNSTSAEGGAIYSESTVFIEGTVTISGNTGAGGATSNIVLKNDSSVTDMENEDPVTVYVTDVLNGSSIGVKVLDPAVGVPVVYVDPDIEGMTAAEALAQFTYDDDAYTLDAFGALQSTDTPAPIELALKLSGSSWISTSKVQVNGTVNASGVAYIKVVKTGSAAPTAEQIIAADQKMNVTANENFTFTHTFTAAEKKEVGTDAVTIYICVKDSATGNTVVSSIDMNQNARPPRVSGVSAVWTGHSSAKITCISDKAGTAYWGWVERGASAPGIDKCTQVSTVAANANFDVYADNLDSDNAIDVYIYVKGNDGTVSAPLLAQLNQNSRPAVNPTTTPTRNPIVPAVTDSKVTGLENPLEFYPNTFYEFTVIGAGTDNTDPVEGDVRWVPLYWSTFSNPSDGDKHSTWKIGAKGGIKDANTYNLYVFFRQEKYNGNDWQPTDNIVSVTYQFRSADISGKISATPTPTVPAGYYVDENGNLVSRTDDTTDTGSSTATGANTADESPIGTMSMLVVLSLLAGGYVITRRRKKVTE